MSKNSKEFIEKMNSYRENNNIIKSKFVNIDKKKTASQIDTCANTFYLKTYVNYENEKYNLDDKYKKFKPFFICKNKFCSNCAYLRSRKLFCETYQVLQNIVENKKVDFIAYHLTLTVKNPAIKDYTHYQNVMNKALILMMKKSSKYKFKNYILGYQASRETTQSPEAKQRNELHPHIHILLLLKTDFYNEKLRRYKLTQNDILAEWNDCLKHYDKSFPDSTQIAFKKIQSKTEAEAAVYGKSVDLQNSAIAEVSKYPVKISDLTNMSDNHFEVLNNALHGARLITYGGIIKQVRAELKINDNKIDDMFLSENKYKLIAIELYNLLNDKYQRRKFDEVDKVVYNELHKKDDEKYSEFLEGRAYLDPNI